MVSSFGHNDPLTARIFQVRDLQKVPDTPQCTVSPLGENADLPAIAWAAAGLPTIAWATVGMRVRPCESSHKKPSAPQVTHCNFPLVLEPYDMRDRVTDEARAS